MTGFCRFLEGTVTKGLQACYRPIPHYIWHTGGGSGRMHSYKGFSSSPGANRYLHRVYTGTSRRKNRGRRERNSGPTFRLHPERSCAVRAPGCSRVLIKYVGQHERLCYYSSQRISAVGNSCCTPSTYRAVCTLAQSSFAVPPSTHRSKRTSIALPFPKSSVNVSPR